MYDRREDMPGKHIHNEKAFAESRLYRGCLYNRLSANALKLLDTLPGMPALRLRLRACLPGYEFAGFLRMPYSGSEVLQQPRYRPLRHINSYQDRYIYGFSGLMK